MPPRSSKRRLEVAEGLRAMETPDVGAQSGTSMVQWLLPRRNHWDTVTIRGIKYVQPCANYGKSKHLEWGIYELMSLLPKHYDSTLQKVQVVKGELIVSVKGVVKNFDKIEMWTDAFLIYMAIFLVKHVAFSVHAQYRSLCGAFLRMGRV
jgi:hypothetical protein